MDYIAGRKNEVADDLARHGFERIGESMWRKGDRRIRWIASREYILGVEGDGRTFIARPGADSDLVREAPIRRFVVVREIE